jgi:uncharacterized protein (UPF0303 family)
MDRAELEALIAQVEAEEAELHFPTLSNDEAIALGASIAEMARSRSLPVTVDIRRGGQQIFHCALAGTSCDNDQWIIRKARVVERFGHCSFLVGLRLKLVGASIEDKYAVSPFEFSAHGGAFPVNIEGTGIVGTVTVSGLPQEEDHALVVEAIRAFIGDK